MATGGHIDELSRVHWSNRKEWRYLHIVQAGSEDDVGDGELDGGSEERRRSRLAAAGEGGGRLVFGYVKSPPQGVQRRFGGWEEKELRGDGRQYNPVQLKTTPGHQLSKSYVLTT